MAPPPAAGCPDGPASSRSGAPAHPAPARPDREAEKRAKAAEKQRAATQAALEADTEVAESRLREVEMSLVNLDRLWRELERLVEMP